MTLDLDVLTLTLQSPGPTASRRYVGVDGSYPASGGRVLGAVRAGALQAGESMDVRVLGLHLVEAETEIDAETLLAAGTDGRCRAAVSGDHVAGWLLEDVAQGQIARSWPIWDGGGVASGGAALSTLTASAATAAGVAAGTVGSFQSAGGDFLVVVEPTAAAPRIKLTAPDGKTISGVFNGGADVTADFDRVAQTQAWLANRDLAAAGYQLLVRTS